MHIKSLVKRSPHILDFNLEISSFFLPVCLYITLSVWKMAVSPPELTGSVVTPCNYPHLDLPPVLTAGVAWMDKKENNVVCEQQEDIKVLSQFNVVCCITSQFYSSNEWGYTLYTPYTCQTLY